eukprot:COSAG02_NODE_22519_length_750_cov_0.626728_1_plen_59_part_10
MYYETSEAKRQADIQRTLRRTIARMTLGLIAKAFAAWKQRYLQVKKLENLKRKALQRFL